MSDKLLLKASQKTVERLTAVFDFVWPTAAAIWNLRWQVAGLVTAVPNLSEDQLRGRFVEGSGIRSGNLRRACIDLSWEDQQREFARFVLFELCALYEGWCESALAELAAPNTLIKQLQFPTSTTTSGTKSGIGMAVGWFSARPSPVFGPLMSGYLCTNTKYSMAKVENLLICYRYFKELRNVLVHAGGAISQKFLQAEHAYVSLSPTDIGVKEKPAFVPFTPSSDVGIALRGVVGLGEVVLRLVSTLDAEFSRSSNAEVLICTRWKAANGVGPLGVPTWAAERAKKVRKVMRKSDFPGIAYSTQLDAWMKSSGLIT